LGARSDRARKERRDQPRAGSEPAVHP
jgi:hypothetical protein